MAGSAGVAEIEYRMRVHELQLKLAAMVAADPTVADLPVCTYDDTFIYGSSNARVLPPGQRPAEGAGETRSDRVVVIG